MESPNPSLTSGDTSTADEKRAPLTTLALSLTNTTITTTATPTATSLMSTHPLNLTPDEKQALLFNVDNSFEVLEEEFDEHWWPLVSNVWTDYNHFKLKNGGTWKVFTCRFTKHRDSSKRSKEENPDKKRRKTMIRPSGLCQARIRILRSVSSKFVRIERCKNSQNHSHTLEDSDRLKRPEAIRALVKQEAVKSYPPVAIVNAVKDLASSELNLGNSVQELKRKEVANIKYKLRGPMEAHLVGSDKLNSDVSEAVSYLKKQEYYVEHYHTSQQPTKGISRRSTQGFVFARPQQFEKLRLYGWLTQMDSTHKTNKHDWRLFTLYIRNGYRC